MTEVKILPDRIFVLDKSIGDFLMKYRNGKFIYYPRLPELVKVRTLQIVIRKLMEQNNDDEM